MTEPAESNRRRHPRYPVTRLSVIFHPTFDPFEVLKASPPRKAVAADLSATGARLVTSAPLKEGSVIRVQLLIPALCEELHFRGRVVRCTESDRKLQDKPQYVIALAIVQAGHDYHELLELVQNNDHTGPGAALPSRSGMGVHRRLYKKRWG